jgi:hypothetical protein
VALTQLVRFKLTAEDIPSKLSRSDISTFSTAARQIDGRGFHLPDGPLWPRSLALIAGMLENLNSGCGVVNSSGSRMRRGASLAGHMYQKALEDCLQLRTSRRNWRFSQAQQNYDINNCRKSLEIPPKV